MTHRTTFEPDTVDALATSAHGSVPVLPNVVPAVDSATVLSQVRAALAFHQATPGDAAAATQLRHALGAASTMVAGWPRREMGSASADDARRLLAEVSASGAHDSPVPPADLARAEKLAESSVNKGWPAMLAAMLVAPAWQLTQAPLLVMVPEFLRADYVRWLFSTPLGFSEVGDAERYAAFSLKRLEEMVRWMNRRPGEEAETEVLGAYATAASVIPLYFSAGSLRRHAELRGQLLTRAFAQPGDHFDDVVTPRAGRRLRVGIFNRHFGPQTETYCTLPTFEELDTDRFEVILFSLRSGDSVLESYCRSHASDMFVLPEDIDGQLAMLRAAALDIIVFGTNITAVFNEVTRIALHRVAPLQVANISSCITSGLPCVDLYTSGTLTEIDGAAANYTERLGLMPGPAHAFNYSADGEEPQVPTTRAEFGIPEDAMLFVSGSNYFKIIPEMQHAWARLLAVVPGSYLLLHPFNPNWSSDYPIARFRAEFEKVLALHQVDPTRLAISTLRFPSRTDVKGLLSLGNVYLDTFPFGGVTSLVDPLELGLPVVAWEGNTFRSRMGAALLRSLDLAGLIAASEAEYLATAVKLAVDAGERNAVASRIRAKMAQGPLFLDPLAASDAFGDLVETAYDELASVGRDAFRSSVIPWRSTAGPVGEAESAAMTPISAARAVLRGAPADPAARHQLGRALLGAGRAPRAVTYLLAALQGDEGKAELWLDVARALQAEGKVGEALQALEAGLKIDETLLDGWVLFAELAHALGSIDIAREAAEVAQGLAPHDVRVLPYL